MFDSTNGFKCQAVWDKLYPRCNGHQQVWTKIFCRRTSVSAYIMQCWGRECFPGNLSSTQRSGIGSESPRTTMFNMYYNGIKRMLRDGCTGIPNLSQRSQQSCWQHLKVWAIVSEKLKEPTFEYVFCLYRYDPTTYFCR